MGNKIFLIVLVAFLSQVSLSECQDVSSIWNELWSVSCEFSGVVSRSRRSIPEGPNLKDPKEFFNYLYPLADLNLEDLLQDEHRSSSPLLVSTWVDDLIDLWQTRCHSRLAREKRSPYRRGDDTQDLEVADDAVDSSSVTGDSTKGAPTTTGLEGKVEKKVVVDTDRFFAQYGGDIEYFFPLIQFGIPFDGEITVLGFKGFKGIWPYS